MSYLIDTVSDYLDNSPNPEEEADDLFRHLKDRLGWAGVYFQRADVESVLDRPLTDEEWKKVRDTRTWNRMGEMMLDAGDWDYIDLALNEANIDE